jgi:urocanate hydratase
MKDGSDALSDWALLNALLNTRARDVGELPSRRRPWAWGTRSKCGVVIVCDRHPRGGGEA